MSVVYLFGGNGSGIRQANRIVNYCYNSSNPYKCLGISNLNPEPKPVDPNDYVNLNYILSINGYLTSDYNVAKQAKNKPFWELLYQSAETLIYYDYVSITNSVQNIDADNYNWNVLEPGVSAIVRNDKRYFIYNQSYVLKEDVSTDIFPLTKYIPLIDKNGTELGISSPLRLTTTLTSLASGRYIESIINRTSAFVYEPDNIVFILIDTTNKKIYAMQTWTNNTPTTADPPPDFFTVSPGNLLNPTTEEAPFLYDIFT